MNEQTFQIVMALIAIISTLVGGTGAVIGGKASNKSKSLERELGELKTHQENQKTINNEIKKDLKVLDRKIDEIKNILIDKRGEK